MASALEHLGTERISMYSNHFDNDGPRSKETHCWH